MTEIAQTLSGFSIVRIGTNDIEISILGRYTVTIKFVDGSYAVERLTVGHHLFKVSAACTY